MLVLEFLWFLLQPLLSLQFFYPYYSSNYFHMSPCYKYTKVKNEIPLSRNEFANMVIKHVTMKFWNKNVFLHKLGKWWLNIFIFYLIRFQLILVEMHNYINMEWKLKIKSHIYLWLYNHKMIWLVYSTDDMVDWI